MAFVSVRHTEHNIPSNSCQTHRPYLDYNVLGTCGGAATRHTVYPNSTFGGLL